MRVPPHTAQAAKAQGLAIALDGANKWVLVACPNPSALSSSKKKRKITRQSRLKTREKRLDKMMEIIEASYWLGMLFS